MDDAALKKQVIYAGFYPRIFASLIDLILSSLILTPLFFLFTAFLHGDTPPSTVIKPVAMDVFSRYKVEAPSFSSSVNVVMDAIPQILADPRMHDYFITGGGLTRVIADQLVQIIICGIVLIAFWRVRSATPGKMILSMKIVDAETLGKLSKKQEVIRFLAYTVSFLPCCLGFIWIAFDKKKQGFHDKLAGTVVIKK